MTLNKININSSSVSIQIPQVYIICIMKPEPLMYVGQTCQKNGILGRFYQHMSGGTLSQIMMKNDIYGFGDISVMAVNLSEYNIFNDVYSRKREALEYLIQREMKVEGCKTFIPFKVISQVFYNSEITNPNLEKIAKIIVKDLIKRIPFNKNYS